MTRPLDLVLPRYGERSLGEVLDAVGSGLGLPGWTDLLGLPSADRWVVLLVDGLGWHLLDQHRDVAPYLAAMVDERPPLTAGVPATTATSLTSLGTGLTPGRHGAVGYTQRIPGTLRLLNSLTWNDGVDPREWQPHQTSFERLDDAGADVTVVNRASFAGSGLTLLSQRGVRYEAADTSWERLAEVVRAAERPQSMTYAYESALDHAGHQHGCESDIWRDRLTAIDQEAAQLRAELPSGTVLVITGDHGMIDVGPDDRFDVDDEPELLADVVLFGGEARFRHLYTRAGAATDVAARWASRLGHRVLVRTREEAEAEGWFGPVDPAVRPRLGDVVVAATGDFAVFSSSAFPQEQTMVGFHGSLTALEMEVPLLVDPG